MENLDNNIPNSQETAGEGDPISSQAKSSSIKAAYEATSIESNHPETQNDSLTETENSSKAEASKVLEKKPIVLKEINNQDIFTSIEKGFPKQESKIEYAFPHPRYWIGPRFMAIWVLPIIVIKKINDLANRLNPVRPYEKLDFSVTKADTIYTSTKQSLEGNGSMRFFGARFLAIWVLPLAITGIFMEYLFVAPLTGSNPFG
ncbi:MULTISPECIES: hypothetical protein [Prochlorococcus]|uniref:Uncharacterized protein n=1 Tax=Prochlorococcus marinus (strain SARG / CCMP1375 / SS120) TaxID=167539 RepID=Q7VAH0_PROMA|nr:MULTISPECIES: hypothetical protein [Prochlorococcus]AAQ00537.1 Predicted protein [Prochlorococcus marinus subsp. marinus str. CCMP1375]KGG10291.1 hypothetical protein EV04_1957 [Prochlorococcus marinus str. LG]KGG22622.1 hypothetical protein EV08_0037 [Prochlorococcus marinus str. SS2]KGG24225.1 hypothetical protein EV09_0832 [Prochlorococcus marinus str. SS35]KGG33162.1 hypothetical protein EV10_0795 [Prochlorococcus marinus str. SS51]